MRHAAALCCALLATLALAQEGGKVYGPDYLRPEQIRQCLKDRNQIVAYNRQLAEEQIELDRITAEIEAEDKNLIASGKHLDGRNQQLHDLDAEIHYPSGGVQPLPSVGNPAQHPAASANELDLYLQQLRQLKAERQLLSDAVIAHRRRLEAHSAKVDNFNARAAALRQSADAVDQRCTTAKTYPDDLRDARAAVAAEAAKP